MRIVTVGNSPYSNTSKAKIHARIIKYFVKQGHEVSSLVWGHDINYHTPDDSEQFWFRFDNQKTRLFPYTLRNPEIQIYDAIRDNSPDIIVTVGDFRELASMGTVRNYLDVKWLLVFTTAVNRVTDSMMEFLGKADGILCTSECAASVVKKQFKKDTFDFVLVGNENPEFCLSELPLEYHAMMNCKRMAQDNLAMGIEVFSRNKLKLYAHTNIHEQTGDYDPVSLADFFDPENNYITLPETFVSTVDGIPTKDLSQRYQQSSLFISIPVMASTALTVFEAMSCGCFPLMTDSGVNRELASLLEKHFNGAINRNDFLIKSIPLMVPGETYIHIPDPQDLELKVMNALKKSEDDKGLRREFAEFSSRYDGTEFLTKVGQMLELTFKSAPTLILETV